MYSSPLGVVVLTFPIICTVLVLYVHYKEKSHSTIFVSITSHPFKCTTTKGLCPESIEWLYGSVPRPPPYPLSLQQVASLSQSSCESPVEVTGGERRRGGGGRGAESYVSKKAWPSINRLILSACTSMK